MPVLRCVPFTESLFIYVPVTPPMSQATVDSGRDPPSALTRYDTQTTPFGLFRIFDRLDGGGALGGCCRIILRTINNEITSGRDFPLCDLTIPKRFHLDPRTDSAHSIPILALKLK